MQVVLLWNGGNSSSSSYLHWFVVVVAISTDLHPSEQEAVF